MINLNPISIDNAELTKKVFNARRGSRKDKLNKIFAYIKFDYLEYKNQRFSLEKLVPDKNVTLSRDDLEYCYKKAKEFDEIKQNIYDNVPNSNDKCLYCGISEADTLDHYLNKAEYPEFSIFTDNLIPCCSKCNRKKQAWKIAGKRIIFNNYFDSIIINDYLIVDIGFSKDVPFIKDVRLDFSGTTATTKQRDLIEQHYEELELINRYKKSARTSLNTLIESIKNKKKRRNLSKASIKEDIEAEIETYEHIFGNNHWEAAVYKGVLNNDDVLDWLSNL